MIADSTEATLILVDDDDQDAMMLRSTAARGAARHPHRAPAGG